jgi:regulator of protease activity HflC (stomatin/prohibitin superfamily)
MAGMLSQQDQKGNGGRYAWAKVVVIGVLIIVGLILLTAINPFVIVGAGERGVVLRFGAVQGQVLGEGLHFRMPIRDSVIKVDIKVQKAQTHAAAASRDLQQVTTDIALNYHIDPDMAHNVYQRIGIDFKARVIDPAVQEAVKAVTAEFTAEQLISERPKVREEIKRLLSERLSPFHILVDDFSIINFEFSKEFNRAIEEKQTAEQLALKARRDLDRIRIEAEQQIAKAKAEAESLRLQKQEVTPELIRLREIEAQLKAIDKWDGRLPGVVGSGAVPFINVGGGK